MKKYLSILEDDCPLEHLEKHISEEFGRTLYWGPRTFASEVVYYHRNCSEELRLQIRSFWKFYSLTK